MALPSELPLLLEVNNPHWYGEPLLREEPFPRAIFPRVEALLQKGVAPLLYGPRRVGKTTILKYIGQRYMESRKPEEVLYFSFEGPSPRPLHVVKAWANHRRVPLHRLRGLLLFDEIQKVPEWGRDVKYILDNLPLKVILSGSSSAQLRKGSESLAGRVEEVEVEALSFREFLALRYPSPPEVEGPFLEYLHRQLPELAMGRREPRSYVASLIRKAIYEDAVQLFSIQNPEELEALFHILASRPGQLVKLEPLSRELGLSRNTLSRYLHSLEELLLVRRLYNAKGGRRKSEVKAKKFYPYYPTFTAHLPPGTVDVSLLVENYVAALLKAEHFLYDRGREVDFLICEGLSTAVEVKWRSSVSASDLSYLLSFKGRKVVVVKPTTSLPTLKDVTFLTPMELEERSLC